MGRGLFGVSAAGHDSPGGDVIEVRVAELRQLFNAIDPSPFHERDLDPKAEEFIVGWGRDLPPNSPLALVVHVDGPAAEKNEAASLRDAIREYFSRRATESRRRLRDLFHRGRLSLAIALAFLAAALAVGEQLAGHFPGSRVAIVVREGVLIVGWVAMWRPLEIFLYDWWPIRADSRLFERLAQMSVRIDYGDSAPSKGWRGDRSIAATRTLKR